MFCIYHISPVDSQNPKEYVTEVCYSVKKEVNRMVARSRLQYADGFLLHKAPEEQHKQSMKNPKSACIDLLDYSAIFHEIGPFYQEWRVLH